MQDDMTAYQWLSKRSTTAGLLRGAAIVGVRSSVPLRTSSDKVKAHYEGKPAFYPAIASLSRTARQTGARSPETAPRQAHP